MVNKVNMLHINHCMNFINQIIICKKEKIYQ